MADGDPAAPWAPPPTEPGPAPGVEFAPHGPRLLAWIIDVVILSIIATVLSLVAAAIASSGATPTGPNTVAVSPTAVGGSVLVVLIVFLVTLAYFPWFWARGGQTPGMRPFRLWVVRDADGGPIGAGTAILRLLGYYVSSLVFYLGFVWILVDARRRGWHDLIAGTLVVHRP